MAAIIITKTRKAAPIPVMRPALSEKKEDPPEDLEGSNGIGMSVARGSLTEVGRAVVDGIGVEFAATGDTALGTTVVGLAGAVAGVTTTEVGDEEGGCCWVEVEFCDMTGVCFARLGVGVEVKGRRTDGRRISGENSKR